MNSDTPCETPLVELLERVPADARMTYEHHSTHHQMIPVGNLCRRAAAEMRALSTNSDIIRKLVAALDAVELARTTDESEDWQRATKLTDAALSEARKAMKGDDA